MFPSVSPELHLMNEWRRAFEERDLVLLAHCLSDNFARIIYPQSVHQKTQTKDEFIEELAEVFPTWTKLESIVHSTVDTPKHVVIHFTNKVRTRHGANPPYESMINATFILNEYGALKIDRVDEFVDSKTYLQNMKAATVAHAK